jgi:hypothetical protein
VRNSDLQSYVRSVLALRQDLDATSLAEALWIAAARSGPGERTPPGQVSTALQERDPAESRPQPSTPASGRRGPDVEPPVPPAPARRRASTAVSGQISAISLAKPRPEPLDLARSLRPFKRRWVDGRRTQLDLDATVESYARTWQLVPQFRPAPERWFEVSLVVDDSPSMAVWDEMVSNLTGLLRQLGAFRGIRSWRLSLAGTDPELRDAHDHSYAAGHLRAPHGRSLIIVVSDGSAAGWLRPEIWHAIRAWAASTPTALISPLSTRLWRRTGLDLPAVRAGPADPGVRNALLRYSVPPLLRAIADEQWLPLPVATLSPHMLGNWARTLMRRDPIGCDALLIPSSGRLPEDADAEEADLSGAALVRAFLRSASPHAAKLVTLCAPFASVSLPLLNFIRHKLVPAASTEDLAEVVVGGLFLPPEDTVLRYRRGVQPHLRQLLAEPDAWHMYEALSREVADQTHTDATFPAIVPGETGDVTLPTELQALATASREALEFLDITESAPVTTQVEALNSVQGEPSIPPAAQEEADLIVPDSVPVIWGDVPPRNKNFTGRAEILTRLRQDGPLVERVPRVLTGLPGVGKTAVAVEYAYRHQSDYDVVWWIPAEQPALVRTSLAQLAARLHLIDATVSGIEDAAGAALDALRRGEPFRRWLMIFDNADRPEDFREYLPRGAGTILITSRNPGWESVADRLTVGVFSREASLAFLTRRVAGLASSDADLLAEKLGDLPLALDQAGAMVAQTGMPTEEYLQLLDEQLLRIMAEGGSSEYPYSMTAAWRVAVDKVRHLLPEALEFLRTCAFFAPEPIPRDIFGRSSSVMDSEREFLKDPILLAGAIRELGRFGLVSIVGRAISVHCLSQAMLRDELDGEERESYRREAQHILTSGAPRDPDDDTMWSRFEELVPHVASAVLELPRSRDPYVRAFALKMMRYLYLSGDVPGCLALAERFIEQWTADSGPDDESVLWALVYLGDASRALGRHREAGRITEDALSRVRASLSEGHPLMLTLRSALGADARARGDFAAALRLDTETRELHEQAFGQADPRTMRALDGLALDYELNADYNRATELYMGAYRSRAESRGGITVSPTELLISWTGLARSIRLAGHFAEARDMAEDAFDFARDRLGPGHYVTLTVMTELSIALRRVNSEQALALATDANDQCLQILGVDHPSALAAATSLWNVRMATGLFPGSLDLAEATARSHYPRVYGPDHPYSHASAGNLAVLRRVTGDPYEARRINETALAGLDATLSRDHHYSLVVAANLASDLAALGDLSLARTLGVDTLARSRVLLGADHPHTLGCASNLAVDLRADGAVTDAASLAEETLFRYAATVGEQDPDATASRAGLRIDFDLDPPPIF